MDAIDLASLDQTPPVDLDPSLWTANLAALRVEQPELAAQLEDTRLPTDWRPVAGFDGFPTYRIEPADQQPRWLGGTAAPQTRAEALLRWDQIGEKNPGLPTVAAGAEVKLLLGRLGRQQAVYVFEEETQQLAAILHTLDLARHLANGRCIFVPPERESVFLEQLLERHPGLMPPGSLITLPMVASERMERLRRICETVSRQTNETRSRRLAALTARAADLERLTTDNHSPAPGSASLRLAVLALGQDRRNHELCDELVSAAEKLQWRTSRCAATDPRKAHVLPHCEQLADFGAELAIRIDPTPRSLPLPAGKVVCQWHLHAKDVPESLPDDGTVHLAASPQIAHVLRAAGVAEARLADLHWALSEPTTGNPQLTLAADEPQVVVVAGNLPDASEAACRIDQPTHKRLWAQLRQTAEKEWKTARIRQPATLLRAAERASGIEFGESSLRRQMIRIIEHVLIPAVVLERIWRLLQKVAAGARAGCPAFDVVTVGSGWRRCLTETQRQTAASTLTDLVKRTRPDPHEGHREGHPAVSAAIFAGPTDPLNPAMFQAAAFGWPVLIHCPGGESLTPLLGGILHPQQHYDPFSGSQDLRTVLEGILTDPEQAQRRNARLRVHLREQHGYERRLTSLACQLGLRQPETAV